jgi:sigma-B regulation protein RsbU (phosphoserine phosphatase)
MSISFKAKLLLFTLAVILVATAVLVFYFIGSFNAITRFSLEQNKEGLERTNREFLTNLAADKARLTSLQLKRAVESISILGKTTQKLLDNYEDLSRVQDLYQVPLYRDNLIPYKGALTNAPSEPVNVLIPPSLTGRPRARKLLRVSALLSPLIGPVFESNENNTFVYFVGDRESPVTRAFPNINLAEYLGEALDFLFWRDFFQDNVKHWERYYQERELRDQVNAKAGSPVTFDPPYEDAAGQGKIITLFYPLWDRKTDRFAGVVAADVSLAKIVENVLSVHVAQTGYAVLLNGKGEIVAMSEQAEGQLRVQVEEIQRNGLKYYYRSLATSADGGIRSSYQQILDEEAGYLSVRMDDGWNHILVFASLDPINDSQYAADRWKILINVPEREILATLFETHQAITAQNSRSILLALAFVAGIVAVVIVATFFIAGTITKSIGQLSLAAQKISRKDYDIELDIRSRDEIGQLGQAFTSMSRDIKGYTEHLEDMVKERTEKLQQALREISVLNSRLQDENLRLSAELDVAKRLQLMVLPGREELAGIRDLDIACHMSPADEVGGDYFDCFQSNGSVKFGIGDVTGHGLSAGVIMLMAQTAIKTVALMGELDMKRFLALVNKVLYSNIVRISEDRSMTLSLIDYRDRTFTVTGQHESLIVCRRDGRIELMDTADLGLFLGFEPDISRFVGETRLRLEPGDTLVLYTDGVTEAVNEKNQPFGIRRLCQAVALHHDRPAATILERVAALLKAFIGSSKVHDDFSLMVIKQR